MSRPASWMIVTVMLSAACDDTVRAVDEKTRDERAVLEQKAQQAGQDLENGARKATQAVEKTAENVADAAAHVVDRVDKDIAKTVRGDDAKR